MVRQPNPLVVTTSAGAVVALTIIWWVLLVALGVSLARLTNGRWWLILVRCGIGGTILLSIPVRLGRQTALLDREFGDPIIAIPLVCGAVYAAWTVWTELITPRLASTGNPRRAARRGLDCRRHPTTPRPCVRRPVSADRVPVPERVDR